MSDGGSCPRLVAVAAAVAAASLLACSNGWLSVSAPRAGFWFERGPFVMPADPTFGGPLHNEEMETIERLARAEIARAFSGLRVTVTSEPNAFWRVQVVTSLAKEHVLPMAGESLPLGLLGGTGAVAFDMVAYHAVRYAPPGASRQRVIEAIGRGVGRVAVHEFMHQMLGAAAVHNVADENSYEYGRPDRPSQYYGELHWTTAWPLLQRQFGT